MVRFLLERKTQTVGGGGGGGDVSVCMCLRGGGRRGVVISLPSSTVVPCIASECPFLAPVM